VDSVFVFGVGVGVGVGRHQLIEVIEGKFVIGEWERLWKTTSNRLGILYILHESKVARAGMSRYESRSKAAWCIVMYMQHEHVSNSEKAEQKYIRKVVCHEPDISCLAARSSAYL
jgi:hypothetical protein